MNNIKQAFLNYKLKTIEIDVKEIGVKLYAKKWSAKERAKILSSVQKVEQLQDENNIIDMYETMSKIIQQTALEENGNRVFNDTKEDLEILLNFDGELIQEVFEQIMDINGMGEKAVKEAAKN